jgi:hypothetical protein
LRITLSTSLPEGKLDQIVSGLWRIFTQADLRELTDVTMFDAMR